MSKLIGESVDLGRRVVCRMLALAGLGFLVGCGSGAPGESTDDSEPEPAPEPEPQPDPEPDPEPEPQPDPGPSQEGGKVVHVHAPSATSWQGETAFWEHVSQPVIDDMVDQGMIALTGAATVAEAWRTVLPSYREGQGIAIKVNLNNAYSCGSAGGDIDALMEPVNAVVRGLKSIGVLESDIGVYDAVRAMPDRFVDVSRYPGILYFADTVCSHGPATFQSDDPDATVAFSPPAGVPAPSAERIADVLIDATYLINMPILKAHQNAGVTLGFKNHFGTIDRPGALHDYIGPSRKYFRSDWSVLLDIFRNPHIGDKTILTIGDGLLGALDGCCAPPVKWSTFGGDVPSSLFFSTDPVAIDCVMCDFLMAERSITDDAAAYLRLAGEAGLGSFEHGDPWGDGYAVIDYEKITL